ncbi:MAG: adenosylmethionine decarboxylase [Bacteroidota bacterium]
MSVPPPSPAHLGRHVLLDLYEVPREFLLAPETAHGILRAAAQKMGATVVDAKFHAFSPYGVSGVLIIAESHLTVHTWPEHGYAAIDVFSCGELDLEAGLAHLVAAFSAGRHEVRPFARGRILQGS